MSRGRVSDSDKWLRTHATLLRRATNREDMGPQASRIIVAI